MSSPLDDDELDYDPDETEGIITRSKSGSVKRSAEKQSEPVNKKKRKKSKKEPINVEEDNIEEFLLREGFESDEELEFDINTSLSISDSLQWDIAHAIRELLLNASDQDSESKTFYENGVFYIRNSGSGLKKTNFTYKPNADKIDDSTKSGKFGYGLKDAVVILAAHGIRFRAQSKHGTFESILDDNVKSYSKLKFKYYPKRKSSNSGTIQELTLFKDRNLHPSITRVTLTEFEEQIQFAKDSCISFNETIRKNYECERIYDGKEELGQIFFHKIQHETDYASPITCPLHDFLFVHNCRYPLPNQLENSDRRFLFVYNLLLDKRHLTSRDRDSIPHYWHHRIEKLIKQSEFALHCLIAAGKRKDVASIYELQNTNILKSTTGLQKDLENEQKENLHKLKRVQERITVVEKEIDESVGKIKELETKVATADNRKAKQVYEKQLTTERTTLESNQEILSKHIKQAKELQESCVFSVKPKVYIAANATRHVDPQDAERFSFARISKPSFPEFRLYPSLEEAKEMIRLNLDYQDPGMLQLFKVLWKFLQLLNLQEAVIVQRFSENSSAGRKCFFRPLLSDTDGGKYELHIDFQSFINSSLDLIACLATELSSLPLPIFQNARNQVERVANVVALMFFGYPDEFTYKPISPDRMFLPQRNCFTPLLVCTEWGTSKGGISSFNMQLAEGLSPFCEKVFVLLTNYSIEDKKTPSLGLLPNSNNVYLVDGYEYHKEFVPVLPVPELEITHVIGHAHITGEIAASIVRSHRFKHTKLWQFNHVMPELVDLMKNKRDPEDDRLTHKLRSSHSKHQTIAELNEEADHVWSVGSYMFHYWEDKPRISSKHSEFFLPLNPTFLAPTAMTKKERFTNNERRILFVGRVEDVLYVKGLDIALLAYERFRTDPSHQNMQIKLRIRGIPLDDQAVVLDELFTGSGDNVFNGNLRVEFREFKEQSDVIEDFHWADLFIMPSRCEPFGLVATEAIACGVPILVSGNSGVAHLLKDSNCPDADSMIVQSTIAPTKLQYSAQETERTVQRWTDALKSFFSQSDSSFPFQKAIRVRHHLAAHLQSVNSYEQMLEQAKKDANH